MKIKRIYIENFRSYKDRITIDFNDLTILVGKNDIGKSTVLEALDIFFNDKNAVVKIDKEDINKEAQKEGNFQTTIGVTFTQFPREMILDEVVTTSLQNEYLLNREGDLEIVKVFQNAGTPKIYLNAYHPTHKDCQNLLLKKQGDLQKIINEIGIDCEDKRINSQMRQAIWNHFKDDLDLNEIHIDVTKEDARKVYEKLQMYLPQYSLFQADRKNSDGDSEIQDPLRESVKQIISDPSLSAELDSIANRIKEKLKEISDLTLDKIREMDPNVASTLQANIPETADLKWADVFKNVSITSDDNIPINKRGSGVKRLILLNFFRAQAERRNDINNPEKSRSIIYAIEEPETSQHFANQKKLAKAFRTLAGQGYQILLTTHSSTILKALNNDKDLRQIQVEGDKKTVVPVQANCLSKISLNEISYLAFDEASEEYHNELYGYIELEGWFEDYRSGKKQQKYIEVINKKNKGEKVKELKEKQKILSEYIRHQIHHPENDENDRFTSVQLRQSIEMMREFIVSQKAKMATKS